MDNIIKRWKNEYCWEWFQNVVNNESIVNEDVKKRLWEEDILNNTYFSHIEFMYSKIITWEIIKAYPIVPWADYEWQYEFLGSNGRIITWKIIQENPELPWDYDYISQNENITWEIVQANPDKDWNYRDLSGKDFINWEIVQANPDKQWNYNYLS